MNTPEKIYNIGDHVCINHWIELPPNRYHADKNTYILDRVFFL